MLAVIAALCFVGGALAFTYGLTTEYRQSREDGPVAIVATLPFGVAAALLLTMGQPPSSDGASRSGRTCCCFSRSQWRAATPSRRRRPDTDPDRSSSVGDAMPNPTPRIMRSIAAGIVVLASLACGGGALSDDDRAAIRALDSAYVDAWLRDDTTAVLATLSADAVLMPAGQRPLANREAIRAFWWPRDGSRTRVTRYTTTIDEIGGGSELAYVRGSGELTFIYENDGTQSEFTSRSMTLTVVTRDADGRWRIARRMWGPLTQ